MSPFWKTYQEKLAGGLAQATLWLCTGIFLLGSGLVPSSNIQIRFLLLGIGCVLLILSLVGTIELLSHWFSSRKKVVEPKAAVRPAPTPQDIRRQEAADAAEFARQFPKPDVIPFEVLKRLSHNPRDGSIDAQGVACLFYEGRVTRARPCLKELLDFGYIERAGPAMPGEGNNHYQISQKGITCVNIHAA